MKKQLTGIFAGLACLSLLGGCSLFNNSSSSGYDLESAKEYLDGMYKTANEKETRVDYTLIDQFMIGDDVYTITWTVNVEDSVVKIENNVADDKKVTVNVSETLTADTAYVLTATIAAPDGTTTTTTYNRTVLKEPSCVPAPITAKPVEGTEYKLYMWQDNNKQDLYFTGEMDGYYGATSTTYEEAVTLYVEYAEGSDSEFYIYFNNASNVKSYISVTVSGTHINFGCEDTTPNTKFVYSDTYKTIITVESFTKSDKTEQCYLGTYGTYDTFGPSQLYQADDSFLGNLVTMVDKSTITDETKIATEKAALSVVTSYKGDATVTLPTQGTTYADVTIDWEVAGDNANLDNGTLTITAPATVTLTATLCCGEKSDTATFTIEVKTIGTEISAPEAETAYKFGVTQVSLGKDLYVTGAVSTRYLVTTEDASQAADVYAETVDGGYKFYILVESAKQYINTYLNDEDKISVNFAAETTCVYTYNTTTKAWCTTIDGTDYYLGTYGTFDTISASKTSYITADNTGVTQFPCAFVTKADALTPKFAAETAYKMSVNQVSLDKTLYVTGAVSTRYLSTSETATEGADVYAEAIDGGYKFYILVDSAKQYVNIYFNDENKISVNFAAETTCVFAYNPETKAWYTTIDDTDYYLGTYGTFDTISASKTSYITADNTGVTQFPISFLTKAEAETDTDDTDDDADNAPVLGTPVACTFSVTNEGTTYYLTNTLSNGSLAFTTTAAEAVTYYIAEDTANAGQYYIYYLNGETKMFLTMTSSGTTKYAFVESDATRWTIDTANNRIMNATYNTRAIALYVKDGTAQNVRAYSIVDNNGPTNYPWLYYTPNN